MYAIPEIGKKIILCTDIILSAVFARRLMLPINKTKGSIDAIVTGPKIT